MWFGLDWLVVDCRTRFKTSKIRFPHMKESWVTTSEISWPNITQKIETEIELMISFYENIKRYQRKFKLSPCYSILHSYCVKISVGRKKLSLRPKIKFPKNTKILMLVFPFHLKLLSILEIFTVYSQVQKSHALVTGIKIRLYG